MKLLAYFHSLASRLFHRPEVEQDLDEELQSHIQLRADDLEREGLPRAEAERRARVEFGGRERFKEECREEISGNFFETVVKDVRFSLRVLRKSPGFTLVAVATLALAIGANAVVFGVMNALVLRPLNVPQPESLYGIEHSNEHNMWESYPDYVDLRDRNRSFDGLAGFTIDLVGMDAGDGPTQAWVDVVTGNYFDVLHIQPRLGRFFHGGDEHGPNSAPYIVLSYAYWQARMQGDPSVVGRTVRVNQHPFTIVGVAPAEFHGTLLPSSPDFYAPMVNEEQLEGRNVLDVRRTHSLFMLLGHLKPGITTDQAAADLNSIGAYLEKAYPNDHGTTRFVLAPPAYYGNLLGGPLKAFLAGLMLLAGLILLAACANLGSLFGARAADRSREVALRIAIGASRGRILRQLLTEAMLISLAGGALGLWGSIGLLRALSAWHPIPKYPMTIPVSPDARVYLIALVLAIVSGLLFSIVPVRQVLKVDSYQVIKSGSLHSAGRRITARDVLLVVQVMICAVLVTSSLVAIRGLARSMHSSFGFDPRNAYVITTELAMAGYSGDRVPEMQKRMIDAIKGIPGVDSVGYVTRPPLSGGGFASQIYNDQTSDFRLSNALVTANRFQVSPEYFRAAGTVILAGKAFTWHDDKSAPRVALVNREFARRIFGSMEKALGSHFKLRDGSRVEVVGVVEDGKYESLTEDPDTALFVPLAQMTTSETSLIVRSTRDPQKLTAALRGAVRDLDRGLPFYLETWNQQLDLALFPSRVASVALGVLGAMGAMLSITGIFGMAAYSVSKRLKELGIRIAIGARPEEVLQAALSRAFKLLAIGSAAGLGLGILAARVLAFIVYQASPRDPLVLGGVVFSMALVGLVATWIPAQRALAIDPLTLLREE